jgi:hypothetical protein
MQDNYIFPVNIAEADTAFLKLAQELPCRQGGGSGKHDVRAIRKTRIPVRLLQRSFPIGELRLERDQGVTISERQDICATARVKKL